MTDFREAYLIKLGNILAQIYESDDDGMKALCNNFKVDYNTELKAEDNRGKALELVKCIHARGNIDKLVKWGKEFHPAYAEYWDDKPGIKYYVFSTLDSPEKSKRIYVDAIFFEETKQFQEAKCILLDLDNLPANWFIGLVGGIDNLIFLSSSDLTESHDVVMNAATFIHHLKGTFPYHHWNSHYCKNESELKLIMENVRIRAEIGKISSAALAAHSGS